MLCIMTARSENGTNMKREEYNEPYNVGLKLEVAV